MVLHQLQEALQQNCQAYMILYRVACNNKVEWTDDYDHAHSIAVEWARSLVKHKGTGSVTVDGTKMSMRNVPAFLALLNGQKIGRRRWLCHVENGIPVKETEWHAKMPVAEIKGHETVAHPTFRHADWVKTVHSIPQYQDLMRRAPDHKAALLAFRLSKIDTSLGGFKLTPAIARYVWEWVNST